MRFTTMRAQEKAKTRGVPPPLPPEALLKVDSVLLYVPVSRATWFRGVKKGIFPAPVRLGNLTFWRARDISYLLAHGFKPEKPKRRKKVTH
jgi:prophage regulatory protein